MVWGDKNARVNLRLPEEIRKVLERLAKDSKPKLTLSEYIRDVLIAHAGKFRKSSK